MSAFNLIDPTADTGIIFHRERDQLILPPFDFGWVVLFYRVATSLTGRAHYELRQGPPHRFGAVGPVLDLRPHRNKRYAGGVIFGNQQVDRCPWKLPGISAPVRTVIKKLQPKDEFCATILEICAMEKSSDIVQSRETLGNLIPALTRRLSISTKTAKHALAFHDAHAVRLDEQGVIVMRLRGRWHTYIPIGRAGVGEYGGDVSLRLQLVSDAHEKREHAGFS